MILGAGASKTVFSELRLTTERTCRMYGPPCECKGKACPCRCLKQRTESELRDQSPSGSLYRIILGGAFSTNHQFGHDCDHDCLFGQPIFIGCEGAYSACRSGLR